MAYFSMFDWVDYVVQKYDGDSKDKENILRQLKQFMSVPKTKQEMFQYLYTYEKNLSGYIEDNRVPVQSNITQLNVTHPHNQHPNHNSSTHPNHNHNPNVCFDIEMVKNVCATHNVPLNVNIQQTIQEMHVHQSMSVGQMHVVNQTVDTQEVHALYIGYWKYSRVRVHCLHALHKSKCTFLVVNTDNIFCIQSLKKHGTGKRHKKWEDDGNGSASFWYQCEPCYASGDRTRYYWDKDVPGDAKKFVKHLAVTHRLKKEEADETDEEEKTDTQMAIV